jgi:hypothetical protein
MIISIYKKIKNILYTFYFFMLDLTCKAIILHNKGGVR